MFKIEIESDSLHGLLDQIRGLAVQLGENLGETDVPSGTQAVATESEAPESGSEAPAKEKKTRKPRAKKADTKTVGKRELPAAQTATGKGNGKADAEVPSDEDLNEMARSYAVKHGFETVRAMLTEVGAERISAMTDDQKRSFHVALTQTQEAS